MDTINQERLNVLITTNNLNNLLHSFNILEKHRSQFVGSCLIALMQNFDYTKYQTSSELQQVLKTELDKIKPFVFSHVLNEPDIKELGLKEWTTLFAQIKKELLPFSMNSAGEDLLNLFFTTFNKYVAKADKNQVFTPAHITDFMTDLVHLNHDSKVLDITCGSGAFLIQAKRKTKTDTVYGIEKEPHAATLAMTNMVMHHVSPDNVLCASCFECTDWIKNHQINTVLMNPPFNASKMPDPKLQDKKGMDRTKGLYFVNWVANVVGEGYLCAIIPLACAIGSSKEILACKQDLLAHHTLQAVFSLPDDIFYPSASTNTCIMLFKLGTPHDEHVPTFFGCFKDDGFEKRKNLGRVEIKPWKITKQKWLDAFNQRQTIDGLSVTHCVNAKDEWLAEAYLKTNYAKLNEQDFIKTIQDFIAFKIEDQSKD